MGREERIRSRPFPLLRNPLCGVCQASGSGRSETLGGGTVNSRIGYEGPSCIHERRPTSRRMAIHPTAPQCVKADTTFPAPCIATHNRTICSRAGRPKTRRRYVQIRRSERQTVGFRAGRTSRSVPAGFEKGAQLDQHRRIGFDSNDFGTQRDQGGGQLAGSGAEVEHSRAGRGLEGPGQPQPGPSAGRRRYPGRRRVK